MVAVGESMQRRNPNHGLQKLQTSEIMDFRNYGLQKLPV